MIFFQIVSGSVFVSTTVYLLYMVGQHMISLIDTCLITFAIAVVGQLFVANLGYDSFGAGEHCGGHTDVLLFHRHHGDVARHRKYNL